MSEPAEFYVSCNPPLLPNGVAIVVADIENSLGEIVLEVLYDPEIPWFKFISQTEHQGLITRWMTSRLEQLLESETRVLLPEFEDEEETSQPDVQIIAEIPHVISYPLFQQRCMLIIEQYDPWRYPDNIKDLHHKKIWCAPEASEGNIAMRILSKYEPLWPASLTPLGIEKLGELANCQISHNLQGTLFYLGSDKSVSALDVATRKLNTLTSLLDAPLATTSHLMFTENLDQTKLCYQWITQLGLSRLTYVYPECADLEDKYKRIAGAVTLRNGIANPKGQLIPDTTTYPIEDQAITSKQPEFRPFEGYAYVNKRSGTAAVKKNKRPVPCILSQPTVGSEKGPKATLYTASGNAQATAVSFRSSTRDKRSNETSLAYSPRVPLGGRTSGKVSLQNHTVNRWLVTIKPEVPPEEPNGIEEYENEKPGGFKETNDAEKTVDKSEPGKDRFGRELDSTYDQHKERKSEVDAKYGAKRVLKEHGDDHWEGLPSQEPDDAEEYENATEPSQVQLIGVDGTDAICPEEPDIFRGFSHSGILFPMEQSQTSLLGHQMVASSAQNLMDMSDDPIGIPVLQPVPSSGTKDAQSPHATQSAVIFGKRNDEEKSLHQTMNQKAPHDSSWARIAAKNNLKQKQDPPNFGPNVRVKSNRPFVAKSETKKPVSEEKQTVRGTSSSSSALSNRQQQTYPKESCREIQVDFPASVETGAPTITQGNDECARIFHEAERKLQELVKVLQVVPGHISVQARFGRLCIKDIPAAEVYMNPTPYGPWHTIGTTAKSLNDTNPPVEFSPILTTSAAEANLISQVPGGRTSWVLVGRRVFYEFVCMQELYISGEAEPHCQENRLVVNVDADDFTHECLPLPHEVSRAFVHCTRRAWDIELCISQRDMTQVTEDFEEFAASLVLSMDIATNEIGEIGIQVEPESVTGWHVERVRVCHEATYRNGAKGPSCLKTTMFRVVERIPGTSKSLYRGQSVPVALPRHGQIPQWYEATISSIKAEDVLQENVGLELGEQASWSTDELKRHGAFKAVCEPAIRMVRQMDKVGNSNENGHGTQTDQPPFDAVQYLEDKEKKYSYW
ncbi:hypothetical protein NW768_003367 [Fusarium equiseti]|uniref:Uncharacterized protein n=1 Tax=Fusarium equiseti TaxID=61235 RepID=A0ABQ8RLQ8_FUSEQ|nr:hypothetical protein NW768_003367 [Fusarium equiseti]